MMKASHKVPEGKMVTLEVEEKNGKISEADIRGDFFIEPPEKLEALEDAVQGMSIEASPEEVEGALNKVDAKLIGFSTKDIAKAFKKAVKGEEQ